MSTATVDSADAQSAVEKKKNWTGIVISSVLGGGFALIIAPTVAAVMPVGAAGYVLGTVATGIIGSVTTKVAGNAIDASSITCIIEQYPVQQFYRQTVIRYVGATLESVVTCLRTNTPCEFKSRVLFDLGDKINFQGLDAQHSRRMFFEFSFRVVPISGDRDRAINNTVPPSDLPSYSKDAERKFIIGNDKSLLDGIGRAAAEGAAFGVVGGGLGRLIPKFGGRYILDLVPGKVNIILGMSSATGMAVPVKNLAFPCTEPDRAALFIEFATEVQCHINRLVDCAVRNNTGLEFNMNIGSMRKLHTQFETGTTAGEHGEYYWSAAGTVNKPTDF